MTTYSDFRKALLNKAAKQHIPAHVEFELTSACNFSCSMCYVQDNQKQSLTTIQWKTVFDETVKHGLLFALLTGGEVLTRPDFLELYNYLFDQGVKITIFTNGALITHAIIDTFKKRPPEFVAITLYGSNNDTYEVITNIKQGFDKVNQAITLLQENHIPTLLRTIPLKSIYKDLPNIIAYTQKLNLPLGYFLYVSHSQKPCHQELNQRLSPEELIDFENTIKKTYGQDAQKDFENSGTGFTCAAFRSACFITHQGIIQPCAMLRAPSEPFKKGQFLNQFRKLSKEYKKTDICHACTDCDLKSSCIQCPARRFLEGDAHACAPYLKAIAELRNKQS